MKYPILWYLVGLFVIKESYQLIAGGINLHKGRMLKGALMSGKICTTILFVSLILMVMLPEMPDKVIYGIAVVDMVAMAVAFGNYLFTYFKRDNKFQSLNED